MEPRLAKEKGKGVNDSDEVGDEVVEELIGLKS